MVITVVTKTQFSPDATKQQEKKMKSHRFENLQHSEMRGATGGLGYVQLQAATGLVHNDWLKKAAAKLRANLRVLPPVGPIPPR